MRDGGGGGSNGRDEEEEKPGYQEQNLLMWGAKWLSVTHLSNAAHRSSHPDTSGVQLEMFILFIFIYLFISPFQGFRCIMGTLRLVENDSHNYSINAFDHVRFS